MLCAQRIHGEAHATAPHGPAAAGGAAAGTGAISVAARVDRHFGFGVVPLWMTYARCISSRAAEYALIARTPAQAQAAATRVASDCAHTPVPAAEGAAAQDGFWTDRRRRSVPRRRQRRRSRPSFSLLRQCVASPHQARSVLAESARLVRSAGIDPDATAPSVVVNNRTVAGPLTVGQLLHLTCPALACLGPRFGASTSSPPCTNSSWNGAHAVADAPVRRRGCGGGGGGGGRQGRWR